MNMTMEQMQEQLKALRMENANLKAKKEASGIRLSEKGVISVYGLGRFPVSLYPKQWLELMKRGKDILQFIQDNHEACGFVLKDEE